MASKDTSYLSGLRQRHWDKEKTTVPLSSVSHVKTSGVTATEDRHSVPSYRFIRSRCIYSAKSLAWDRFQKHPLLGRTEAKLPLEMSYGEALDPANDIPEATSRSIVMKALPRLFWGLNIKENHSNIPYLPVCFHKIIFQNNKSFFLVTMVGYNCYQ